MPSDRIRLAVDITGAAISPLTGVGMYTLKQMEAFLRVAEGFDVHFFASAGHIVHEQLHLLISQGAALRTVACPVQLRIALWTRLGWPPLEWFTGTIDVALGMFHLLPATCRHVKRLMTVYDLAWLRCPEWHTDSVGGLHNKMLRHAARHADAFIAISESTKHDVCELLDVSPNRVHVVYAGYSPDEFSGELNRESLTSLLNQFHIREPYFLHLGTLEPRKNIARLIEAYARVRATGKDVPQLVLGGVAGWKYEPIFEAIHAHGLESSVIHTGYLTRADALLLLRGAYALTYPSLYEGFGMPVLEAMAAGIPVLTSDTSSLPEVIGDSGILVEPEKTESICAGLFELLNHHDAARIRAERAQVRAQQFTWDHSARALAQAIRTIADS